MIVINNRITPLDGMVISGIKDIQSKKVVFKNIAFDQVVAIEDMHGNMFAKQPEIMRCKDCKNSEHWYRDRRRCFLWSEDGVSVFDDGFCNYAERRTNE